MNDKEKKESGDAVIDKAIAALRGGDEPVRFFVWPEALGTFDISFSDAALLWTITDHSVKHNFCGLRLDDLAKTFHTSRLSISASIQALSITTPELIKEVFPTKSQREEYIKKFYEPKTKKQEQALLRTNCYRITDAWASYIKPWAGKKASEALGG